MGSVPTDFFVYHSGASFSTYDGDSSGNNCVGKYSNTPFWYKSCWSGSINGGGEYTPSPTGFSYKNGAYWTGSDSIWGDAASGKGGGLGWIYVK